VGKLDIGNGGNPHFRDPVGNDFQPSSLEKAEASRLFQMSNLNFVKMTARGFGGNDLV
jgi:hypothetical protein